MSGWGREGGSFIHDQEYQPSLSSPATPAPLTFSRPRMFARALSPSLLKIYLVVMLDETTVERDIQEGFIDMWRSLLIYSESERVKE